MDQRDYGTYIAAKANTANQKRGKKRRRKGVPRKKDEVTYAPPGKTERSQPRRVEYGKKRFQREGKNRGKNLFVRPGSVSLDTTGGKNK